MENSNYLSSHKYSFQTWVVLKQWLTAQKWLTPWNEGLGAEVVEAGPLVPVQEEDYEDFPLLKMGKESSNPPLAFVQQSQDRF